MSRSVGDYRSRDAEHAVLYREWIDEHLDAFLETTRPQADGVPLPAFVEQEFCDFLRDPGARLRAPAVHGVHARAAGAVLVQGASYALVVGGSIGGVLPRLVV